MTSTGSAASSIVDIYEGEAKGGGDGSVEQRSERNRKKYPEDTYVEHGSHAGSEMSSIGLASVGEQHHQLQPQAHAQEKLQLQEPQQLSQFEELTRSAMISSHHRRVQRRQWNPSFHSSTPAWSAPPTDHHLTASSANFIPEPAVSSSPAPPEIVEENKSPKAASTVTFSAVVQEDTAAADTAAGVSIVDAGVLDSEGQPISGSSNHNSVRAEVLFEPHFNLELMQVDTSPDDSADSNSSSVHPITNSAVEESHFTLNGATDSKYEAYSCLSDRSQNDKSLEIHLYSMKRPHMRAFHLAWMSFFAAFFTWFAITPLLGEVQLSLNLSRKEIWTSSTYGVAGSAVTRILIGPLCDKYGARWAMAGTLFVSAVPTGLTGLVNTASGLNSLRLVIGVAGSAFVTCQYWTSSMFTVEVAGTANALVAGWGNLGGGVTQIVMGSLLFPLFKIIYGGDGSDDADDDRASELAWRTVCIIPAILCFIVSIIVVKYADDCPKGNYGKRSRQGYTTKVSALANLRQAFSDPNTWILFVQYGCCFGVEITMVNAGALYFKDVFGQSTESAAAIASIFGWMNLFARGVGGFLSDMINAKYGMRGRLWLQVATLILEGCFVILFGRSESLGGAIVVMIVLSIFVQAAEGSTFGIVPYVKHSVTGSIAGIIGAGGNVGGVAFAIVFREKEYQNAFLWMGIIAMSSALLSCVTIIRGHAALLVGEDCPNVLKRRSDHNESFGNMPPLTTMETNTGALADGLDQDTPGHRSGCRS